MMDRLRRKSVTNDDSKEFEREMKSADAMWLFIHFLMKYCDDKKWNGMKLNKYWNETTGNGQRTNGHRVISDLFMKRYNLKEYKLFLFRLPI